MKIHGWDRKKEGMGRKEMRKEGKKGGDVRRRMKRKMDGGRINEGKVGKYWIE